ncbi:MAG: ABC transporter permease subunit [Rhizobiales bacterium]|nr:ABC transporter permease subunit [Hyphomicrobiales bacterium]
MALPAHASPLETAWFYFFRFFCGLVLLFLIMPILIIVPLSFNAEPYFTFTDGMLAFEKDAYSMRWYLNILTNGMANPDEPDTWKWLADSWANAQWVHATKNSFIIAIAATIISTTLGTIAALGLSQSNLPYRGLLMGLLISPMIVPIIITSAAMFFFASYSQLTQLDPIDLGFLKITPNLIAIVITHAVLGTPFVVITVTATLVGFDKSLVRAASSLGASPTTTFFKVIMPLILPGVISGALFAFITSFDEVVAVIFFDGYETRTIPRQMFAGIREQISPTILAVATILVVLSILLLTALELLRRRGERLRGMSPG